MKPKNRERLERRCQLLEEKIQACRTRSKKLMREFLTSILEKTRQFGKQERGSQLERREELMKGIARVKEDENEENKTGFAFFAGLPEEVLVMILEQVEDSKDRLSCCRASTQMNRILEPTKPVWLFNEVVPQLAQILDVEDLKNCRLVCSAWKHSVDNFLAKAPFDPATTGMYESELDRLLVLRELEDSRVTLSTREEIARLSTQLSEGDYHLDSRNPFVGRRVTLDQEEYEGGVGVGGTGVVLSREDVERDLREYQSYRADAVKFLKKYGKHIWDGYFRWQNYVFNNCSLVHIVKSRLIRLPNIRGLQLGYDNPLRNDPLTAKDIRKITRRLARRPFPELPHLVTLKLNNTSPGLSKFLLEKYARQLRTLHVSNLDFDNGIMTNTDIITSGIPNLRELKVYVVGPSSCWEDLSDLLLLNSPLEKLEFDFQYDCLFFRSVLKILPKYEDTLKHLDLAYFDWQEEDLLRVKGSINDCLKSLTGVWLPHVQTVRLHGHVESLNFLLCLPSLKALKVAFGTNSHKDICKEVADQEVLDILEKRRCHGCWYKSNVWTLLPSLMEFELEYDGREVRAVFYHTREEYERVKKV